MAAGTALITVSATDIAGSNMPATQTFDVTVKRMRGVTVSRDALTVDEGSSGRLHGGAEHRAGGPRDGDALRAGEQGPVGESDGIEFTTTDWREYQEVSVVADRDADTAADAPVTISHQVSGRRLRLGASVFGPGDDRGDGHVEPVGRSGRRGGERHAHLPGDAEHVERFRRDGGLRNLGRLGRRRRPSRLGLHRGNRHADILCRFGPLPSRSPWPS